MCISAGVDGVDEGGLQWNPDKTMPDCFDRFCCVENAVAKTPVQVKPGESWQATQEFYIVDL